MVKKIYIPFELLYFSTLNQKPGNPSIVFTHDAFNIITKSLYLLDITGVNVFPVLPNSAQSKNVKIDVNGKTYNFRSLLAKYCDVEYLAMPSNNTFQKLDFDDFIFTKENEFDIIEHNVNGAYKITNATLNINSFPPSDKKDYFYSYIKHPNPIDHRELFEIKDAASVALLNILENDAGLNLSRKSFFSALETITSNFSDVSNLNAKFIQEKSSYIHPIPFDESVDERFS